MKYRNLAYWIIGSSLFFLLFFFLLFLFKTNDIDFSQPLETSIFADYGTLVGGIVGTAFTLASVLLIIQSIQSQKQENELQNIESRFFELVKLHRDNVSEFTSKGKAGRNVVIEIHQEFINLYKIAQDEFDDMLKDISKDYEEYLEWNRKIIEVCYLIIFFGIDDDSPIVLRNIIEERIKDKAFFKTFFLPLFLQPIFDEHKKIIDSNKDISKTFRTYKKYDGNQSRLGHYYRHLFQTVKFIDEQPTRLLSYKTKYNYIKTLRAQLSTHEIALLYYNSFSYLGDKWERGVPDTNKKLITKYNLIKNLPIGFTGIQFIPKDYYPNVHFEFLTTKSKARIELEKHYR